MYGFFKNRFFIFIACVVTISLVVMISSLVGRSVNTPVGSGVGVVVSSLQSVTTSVRNGIGGFFSYFTDFKKLSTQNEQLKQQISTLEGQLRDFDRYKVENESLRQLLGLQQENSDFKFVASEVIARDVGNWFSIITIDKGDMVGVKKGDTVITNDGLVGTVTETGPTWSKVSTILEPDTTVGAIVSRSREIGVAEGSLDLKEKGQCRISYLRKGANVVKGDIVETSGLGGKYPKGIVIGEILEVNLESHGISLYGVIQPKVDFSSLKEVFVITSFTNDGVVSK